MNVLLMAIAGFALWQYSEFKKFQESVKVKISKIGFDFNRSLSDGFKNLYLNVTLTVNNSTELNQVLKSIDLKASYNGKVIGAVRSETVLTLKTGDNVYSIPVAINTFNVFNSIQSAITAFKNKTGISLNISGSVMVGSYGLPINENLKVA